MRNLLVFGLLTATAVGTVQSASAQSINDAAETYNFKVSPGRLANVVAEIASQARASVSVESAPDTDVQVQGLTGVYTLRAALSTVLAQSDYDVQEGRNNSFRLVRRGGETEIVVTGRRRDFARTQSNLLTRTDTPLRKTPGTIDSVTEEVLKSQNAISVSEALRNIPGVIFNSSNGEESVIVGQISSQGETYVNGLRGSSLTGNPPITDIEAIEVLKGPAAILQGASLAGGVINFVPKRADGRRGGNVTLGVGSGDEVLGMADIGGAILPEEGVFWRLSMMGEYAKRIPNGGDDPHQYVINPMLGYRGNGVKFDATFQYYDKRTPLRSLAAYDPATDTFQEYGARIDSDGNTSVKSKRGSYNLEVDLASSDTFSLTLRNRGLYQRARRTVEGQFPITYDFLGLGSLLLNTSNRDHDKQLSEYLDLYSKFSTGGVDHQLIIAGDLLHSDTNRAIATDVGFSNDTMPLPLAPIPDMTQARLTRVRQYGAILQDQMTLGRVHALVGLRETFYSAKPFSRGADGNLIPGTATAKTNRFSFNGGVVYDFSQAVSGYFSYTKGFSPASADLLTSSGSILPPQTRTQYELGLKSGLFGDRLTLNMSANTFSTDNSVLSDPTNPAFYVTGTGLKGKGAEISLAGSITPTLKVLAGYTYSKSKDKSDALRQPITGIPRNVANLWAIKTFRLADKQSIDLGLGGNYNSGFNALDFVFGEFYPVKRDNLSVNGSLAYKVGTVTLNVVVNNIFDRHNYLSSGQLGAIQLDTPRSFRATLSAGF